MADLNDTMSHPDDETLAAFLDGALDEAGQAPVIDHLVVCDECREFASTWARCVAAETGERGSTKERVGKSPVRVIGPRREGTKEEAEPRKGGQAAGENLNCFSCGGDVARDDEYCRQCGARLTKSPEATSDKSTAYETGSLIIGIICFAISFFWHGFFWQFLIATALFFGAHLYFRIKREILVDLIDALRSGDKSKEEEVIERLRRKFKR